MAVPKEIEPALRELKLTAAHYGGMTQTELRRHWRDLIKQFHPDRPENRGPARPRRTAISAPSCR